MGMAIGGAAMNDFIWYASGNQARAVSKVLGIPAAGTDLGMYRRWTSDFYVYPGCKLLPTDKSSS